MLDCQRTETLFPQPSHVVLGRKVVDQKKSKNTDAAMLVAHDVASCTT